MSYYLNDISYTYIKRGAKSLSILLLLRGVFKNFYYITILTLIKLSWIIKIEHMKRGAKSLSMLVLLQEGRLRTCCPRRSTFLGLSTPLTLAKTISLLATN